VIHEVQVWENKWYRDKGDIPRQPLTITQARQQHRWRTERQNSA